MGHKLNVLKMKKTITIVLIVALAILFVFVGVFAGDWVVAVSTPAAIFIIAGLTWQVLPRGLKGIFDGRRKKFIGVVLICLVFLFYGGAAINLYVLPERFCSISLLGDAGILLFTIFIGWALIRAKRKRVLFLGAIIFILFVFSLAMVASNTNQETAPFSLEKIKALPYLTWVSREGNVEKTGVAENNGALSYQGLNLYNFDNFPVAYLIDMSGKVVHEWSDGRSQWHYGELDLNGDFLGIVQNHSFVRLDLDSNIRWKKKMPFHHDLDIAENKDIYTIAGKNEIIFDAGPPLPILNDYIVVLSADGEIKEKVSLFEVLKEEIPPGRFSQIYRWWRTKLSSGKEVARMILPKLICARRFYYYDIFHTNTIEIIDRDIEGLCQKGDLLICARELNLIGILDWEKKSLAWSWGPGDLDHPHHPTLLENGNILIFDNGTDRGYSRIVELNPFAENIVWEYKSDPPEQFYSRNRGRSQRLPNGNTLITESTKGRVFEITNDGKVVWEFFSPAIKKKGDRRKTIYSMKRVINPEHYPFLKEL